MIEATLDTSFGISLAIADGRRVVLEANAPFERRASDAVLVPWIEDRFHEIEISLGRVSRWTVGTGPGSFTGLRCGIAFVRGVCLQSAASCRGLPSSLAIAVQTAAARPDSQEIAVLHDARRGQVIVSRYVCTGDDWLPLKEPEVVEPAELPSLVGPDAVLGSPHRQAIEPLLDSAFLGRTVFHESVRAAALLWPPGWEWPEGDRLSASLEPVYVRPPVFVKPATGPREVAAVS